MSAPQDDRRATEELAAAAFQAWSKLAPQEREAERPWIMGFNAGWDARGENDAYVAECRQETIVELHDQAFAAGAARRTLQLIAGKNMIGTVEAILIGMSIEAIDRAWKRPPSQTAPDLLEELDWLAEEFEVLTELQNNASFAHAERDVREGERLAKDARIARANAAIEAVKALLS